MGPFEEQAQDDRPLLDRLGHFCRAAALPGLVIDDEGAVVGLASLDGATRPPAGAGDGACPVCRFIGADESLAELRGQLYGAYQAERFGGKYIHLCPHSLLYLTAPVSTDDALSGALICGPLLLVEPEEVVAEMLSSGRVQPGAVDALRSELANVPHISLPRATSLAETLADVAVVASGHGSERHEAALERERQHAIIAEYIQELKAQEIEREPYPMDKERELLNAISRGDKAESQRLLNEILGHIFFASGQNPAIIKARALELVVLISRAALDGGADLSRIFDLGFTYLNQIQKMRSVDDIAIWLSRVMSRFSDLVFNLGDVKHADVMLKALRHINSRFTEPITLEEVAREVSLSPTYFSKIWNEEMKCRFTAYLNRLRVDRAKVLLRGADTSLVEIASLLGYEDQSYFTKVFKKLVGTSPGRYREAAGRAPRPSEQR